MGGESSKMKKAMEEYEKVSKEIDAQEARIFKILVLSLGVWVYSQFADLLIKHKRRSE